MNKLPNFVTFLGFDYNRNTSIYQNKRLMHTLRNEISFSGQKISNYTALTPLAPRITHINNFNYNLQHKNTVFTRSATYKLELKQTFNENVAKTQDLKINEMERLAHRHPPIVQDNPQKSYDFVANETNSSNNSYLKGTTYTQYGGKNYRVHEKRVNEISKDKVHEKYEPEKISDDNIFDKLPKNKNESSP